jgi:hypothetical protein
MRTTLTLSNAVFQAAKRRAAERGVTLSVIVDEALRAQLAGEAVERKPLELITFGEGGPRPGVNLDRTSAILEQEDDEAFGGSRADR